ncbi:Candidapepsin-10 [Candida tropicalis]
MKLSYLLFIPAVLAGSLQFDLKRKAISSKKREDGEIGVTPEYDRGGFFLELEFGSNKQKIEVLVDTGSSDLWVPAMNVNCSESITSNSATCPTNGYDWEASTTFIRSPVFFETFYGDNTTSSGFFGQDTVWIGDVAVNDTIFAVANHTDSGGTMGIGLPQLEADYIFFNASTYPNFPQKLKMDGIIDRVIYSVLLDEKKSKSSLLFGAVDHEKYTGELLTLPVLSDPEVESNMAIELDSIVLDNGETNSTILSQKSSLFFDTGSTASSFSSEILNALSEQLGGKVAGDNYYVNGTLASESALLITFQNLTILSPIDFVTTEDGQYVLNYNNIDDVGASTDMILGQDVLTQIYAVFDLDGLEVSIAPQSGSSKSDIEVVGADGNFTKQSGDVSETSGDSSEKGGASSVKNVSIYLLVVSALFGLI